MAQLLAMSQCKCATNDAYLDRLCGLGSGQKYLAAVYVGCLEEAGTINWRQADVTALQMVGILMGSVT